MPKIKLDDIDELYVLVDEITSITYLQALLQADYEEEGVFEKKLNISYENISAFLLDRQIETNNRILRLIHKREFLG